MNVVMIVLFAMFVSGMKFAEPNQFFDDYCSVRKTNAIKGIFVMLVVLSHSMDYFHLEESDIWVERMSEYFRQLLVVPFLFYSGYGIMESIQKKGLEYIRSIPVKRALKTVVYADVAVLSFVVLYAVLGKTLTPKKILLSLVFWDKIENNTWYFFVMVCLYLITYLAFRVFHRNHYIAAAATAVLSFGLFLFLVRTKSIIWYNTFFCYHFGMWYSLLRPRIEKLVMKNDLLYTLALLGALLAYMYFRTLGSYYYFIICGCWLMTLIVGITMKVSIDNPLLQFLGRHVLGFYAFHRLPMVLTRYMETGIVYKFIFCVLVTAILALIHDRITGWLDRKVFSRPSRKVSA